MSIENSDGTTSDWEFRAYVVSCDGDLSKHTIENPHGGNLAFLSGLGRITAIETVDNSAWSDRLQTAVLAEGTPTMFPLHEADRTGMYEARHFSGQ